MNPLVPDRCHRAHVKGTLRRSIRLLRHPHFFLLHVPSKGSKMKIINPSKNAYHQMRIMRGKFSSKPRLLPYYALSHLWGVSKTSPHVWNDIGQYVDDENGKPVAPVLMRPEKRDTLLALLKHYPDSYWWIDVLCARTETPLEIMGDIYACCTQCIAMVDCQPNVISKVKDLTRVAQLTDISSAGCSYQGQRQQDHYDHSLILNMKCQYRQWTAHLDKLTQCTWWNRVWTWQELVLPVKTVFMAETTRTISQSTMLSTDDVSIFTTTLEYLIPNSKKGPPLMINPLIWPAEELKYSRAFKKSLISGTLTRRSLLDLIAILGSSNRQCMDPVDYVYGVLGIFQFKVPREIDRHHVWPRFLSQFENLVHDLMHKLPSSADDYYFSLKISDHAHDIDLLGARSMADVYHGLLIFSPYKRRNALVQETIFPHL